MKNKLYACTQCVCVCACDLRAINMLTNVPEPCVKFTNLGSPHT